MRKNRLITLTIKKIKNSFRRFLALAVLSFLGVTVFVGIKMSNPDMMESIDKYFKSQNTYDIKVVSTLGLTDKDIAYIEQQDNNLKVYGSHSKDTEFHIDSKSEVIKLMEITNDINEIIVKEGRLPTNKNEVAIESGITTKLGLNIGEKIYLDVNEDDKTINSKELTLVGTIMSPVYALNSNGNINRGNTNLGVGDIDYYGCVTSDFFNMNYFTEIYIKTKNSFVTNSEEYNSFIDKIMEEINSKKELREIARKDEFVEQANAEIDKKDEEGLKQFSDIKQQLDEAGNELEAGKTKLDQTEQQLNNAKTQLNETKTEIDDGYELIQNGENELNEAKDTLEELKKEIEDAISKYELTYEDVCLIIDVINGKELTREEAISLIPEDLKFYEQIVYIINYVYDNHYENTLKNFINNIKKDEFINKIPKNIQDYDEVVQYIKNLDTSKIRKKILQLLLDEDHIEEIKAKIPKNAIHYNKIIKALNNYEEIAINLKDLYNGVESLEKGFLLYQKNLKLLEDKKQQLIDGEETYTNALNQYNDGLKEYDNGKKIYNDNLNIYNSKIEEYNFNYKKFNEEIEKARKQADSIEKATWFVYSRIDNSDYASYIDSTDSVERLATIFPTIFFIVAIFISSLSMARMAIEDRAEIGTLKSLGFGNMAIRGIYLFYATMATLIGGALRSFGRILYTS